MKKKYIAVITWGLICGLFLAGNVSAQDEVVIDIEKNASRVIPVSVTGFSGEVERILRFDLYVLGMDIVSPEAAEYQVSGSNGGRVEGRLADKVGTTVFSRAYQGGDSRTQAHALAGDVVEKIRNLKSIFGGKITFRVERSGVSEVGVADFDGANTTIVTRDGSLVSAPCWVPGHRKLLYTSWKSGATQIYAHDLNSGERKLFVKIPGSSFSPAVSPDGRRVAFIANRAGSPDLYVCNIDGSDWKQLTKTKDEESSPCWSPDGRYICYAYRSGKAALYKISSDGGSAVKLSTPLVGGTLTEPDWSPDGKMIVFTSFTGSFNICTVPANGGGEAKVLVAGEDPCWAPNSRTVIFTRRESGKRVLSLLDVPTKHVKDVMKISGSCSQPCWAR